MKTPKKKTILIAAAAVVVLAATPALWATVERQAEGRFYPYCCQFISNGSSC